MRREADTYQWTGIAGAQKTSDVAIGHVNLLLDYLPPLSLASSGNAFQLRALQSSLRTRATAAPRPNG